MLYESIALPLSYSGEIRNGRAHFAIRYSAIRYLFSVLTSMVISPSVSAYGRSTSPKFASLKGEEIVGLSHVSPPSGALGGVPAEPGRGVLPKTDNRVRRTDFPLPSALWSRRRPPYRRPEGSKEPSPRCTSFCRGTARIVRFAQGGGDSGSQPWFSPQRSVGGSTVGGGEGGSLLADLRTCGLADLRNQASDPSPAKRLARTSSRRRLAWMSTTASRISSAEDTALRGITSVNGPRGRSWLRTGPPI